MPTINYNRRRLLQSAASLLPIALVPLPAWTHAAGARSLSFVHTHTSEKLDVVYADEGRYVPEALAEINRLLRDFRSGDVHPIDPALLDILHDARQLTGGQRRFAVISAFRSPTTNDMLRHRSGGVAQNSLHVRGQAIDVRLEGVSTRRLREAALAMGRGGVGYYPDSDFLHLDTGRPRAW
jgi:uncharacterized protein YcbK (DUF882 family)